MEKKKNACPLLRSSISVEFTPVTTAEDIAIQVLILFLLSKLWFFVSWAEDGGGGCWDSYLLRIMVVWMIVLLGK